MIKPTMWRWRGPNGGWITDNEKPNGWYSEPLYTHPAIATPEGDVSGEVVEALQFYANSANYMDTPSWDGDPTCFTAAAIPVVREDGQAICDCGDKARAALSEVRSPAKIGVEGWIVGCGSGTKWRTWREGMSAWTDNRDEATRYARRVDAEAVHADDDDAWLIQPYATAAGDRTASGVVPTHRHKKRGSEYIVGRISGDEVTASRVGGNLTGKGKTLVEAVNDLDRQESAGRSALQKHKD